MDYELAFQLEHERKKKIKALGVELTQKQYNVFYDESELLLAGPSCVYHSQMTNYLKKKGLFEQDSIENAIEKLETLTPLGQRVASLFGSAPTPGSIAKELRESLEKNQSFRDGPKYSRADITNLLPKIRVFSDLLRWHAIDCFEIQGGAFSTSIRRKIRSVREKIALRRTSDGVRSRLSKPTDDTILDNLVDLKPFTFPWKNKHFNNVDYAGSAKRMREYAVDRWYDMNPRNHWARFDENNMVHWQGMQLAHLCDIWASCGERSASLLFDGACPFPAFFDEM